ncbi:mitotic checkpoint protein BUB3.1-like [Triticum dicoccoides]|uniref:mitotic checkpoint protein BUB3.1-like n=1 Tax=Triticum dicoccoides TaxID=85692 RepID=UPI0018907E63|nr:mitotic checkpoint protein BUB3.1-like [Triticum dicoccoides]
MSAPATGQPPVDAGGGRIGLGRELGHPPRDGVSNLRFSKHSNRLLVSSWEKAVRLLDVDAATDALVGAFPHKRPVLDCCFHDNDSSAFSASSDHVVRRLSFSSKTSYRLGTHDGPVRCVEYSDTTGQVITGSWDRTIKCWDQRGATGPQYTLIGTHTQPERVYALSLAGHKLVVATAGEHVNVYDLRNMSEPQQRKSFLNSQTRCVECYPNKTGFALGSTDGRVAMDFFDQSESSLEKRYSFKCHRLTEDRGRVAYPVNAIAFHSVHGTFATGGCDGFVYTWDGEKKKRLFQSPKYPTSIAALSFSKDNNLLAVASSYTYERGKIENEPATKIFIRDVNEVEVKPRH